jgi:hypothetical protein
MEQSSEITFNAHDYFILLSYYVLIFNYIHIRKPFFFNIKTICYKKNNESEKDNSQHADHLFQLK